MQEPEIENKRMNGQEIKKKKTLHAINPPQMQHTFSLQTAYIHMQFSSNSVAVTVADCSVNPLCWV